MSEQSPTAVFVYGTLKTGQCREKCWPVAPLDRERAWTAGTLYDTGPYPALTYGKDLVAGQLWFYRSEDLRRVFEELDQIEDYQPGRTSGNMYDRAIVECFTEAGRSVSAYTYLYARLEELPTFRRIAPTYPFNDRLLAVWPEGSDW